MSIEESLTLEYFKRFIQHKEMYEKECEKKLLQWHSHVHAIISGNTVTPKSIVNDDSLLQLKHFLTIANQIYQICSICTRQGTTLLFDNLLSLYEQLKTSFIIGELALFTEAKKELLEKILILKLSQVNDLDILSRLRPSVSDFPSNIFDGFNLDLEYLETLFASLEPAFTARKPNITKRITLSKLHEDVMLIDLDSSTAEIDALSVKYQQYVFNVQQQVLKFKKTKQLVENLFEFPELTESLLGLRTVNFPNTELLLVDKSIVNCLSALNDEGIQLEEKQKELVAMIHSSFS
ncbi:hypothetical protein [uncultured Shewanella sp.]|uniref:hypothetical protein n=1 Tax=uncultured Shewanella sp. TaxID=173975 RepID=UPI0026352AC3|nr:hypothetical protein [uncultured Shewanella sp.]